MVDGNLGGGLPKFEKTCFFSQRWGFNYKHCLEVTQAENRIKHLEKNNLGVNNIWENHKEFIKNNKLILRSR